MSLTYPDGLPVLSHRKEIVELLRKEQVIVVAGDTGSGKTTQLPKFCLEAFPHNTPVIGCTQPRRVAAVSVSGRVAEELGSLGTMVGYKIRFHDHTSPDTKIKFMTDGVLLMETMHDRRLQQYGIIILDEAHERSLNIDFLIGLLKNILPRRPDLKLIITSATIDTSSFAAHFSNAPVINIQGRTYPVEVRYKPSAEDQHNDKEGYVEQCAQEIESLYMTEAPGDILAFLPTQRDVITCCEFLEGRLEDVVVLPMFGRLQSAEQRRIFKTFKETKIVVATNVAETSITVPGIRYVVDSGLARISTYNVRSRTTSLPISRISQASCKQRKGRCGRIAPGVCIRMYSEEDYKSRDEYTLPEIQRSNLAAVILRMIYLKLGDPLRFPFIDTPQKNAVRDGFKLLTELGALDKKKKLTRYGKIMATMPIDPCISRIIIEAGRNHSLKEIKIIAAAIAIQDPRVRPAELEKQADEAHKKFDHPQSDFLCLLNIWDLFHEVQGKVRSWTRLRKFCKTHFLSFQRMREWMDLHEQMGRILKRFPDFSENASEASYQMIHSALASGFLRNIAVKKKNNIYQGVAGRELMIFPGSHQFLKGGQWIIAAAFLETSRLYALTVATIEPEWLEEVGKSLCKYSWSHPRWEKKAGQVIADEKVVLFGLPIVTSRRVNFGRRHPSNRAEARNIFIEHALLPGELRGNFPFLQHNINLVSGWQNTESRLRKRDILMEDNKLFSFYNARLDESVYDRFTLIRYLKSHQQKTLMMTDQDIIKRNPQPCELAQFPPTLTIGSLQLALQYHFDPGSQHDGVTVRIPSSLAPTLNPEIFEWLVPGLLQEKTTFLLKGLPKSIRKQFIPLNNTVDIVLDNLMIYQGCYLRALERSLTKLFKKTVRRTDWPQELPKHLRMRFELFDHQGKTVATGRDLALLVNKTEKKTDADHYIIREEAVITHWKDRIVRQWEFPDLPDKIHLYTSGLKEIAGYLYPAIKALPEKGGVTVCFESTPLSARRLTVVGMTYLYRLQFTDQFKALKRFCATRMSGPSSLWLIEGLGSTKQTIEQVQEFILRELFATGSGTIPDERQFAMTITKVKARGLFQSGMEMCEMVMALLRRRREVKNGIVRFGELAKKTRSFSQERHEEYLQLLDETLPADFLTTYTLQKLEDCDRYLRGLLIRIERAYADYSKEILKKKQLYPHLSNYALLKKKEEKMRDDCLNMMHEYAFLINEFRISLFAPEIGTKVPVSNKKLIRHWQKLNELC